MDIRIERITIENYSMFDDMVAWRINGKERTIEEKAQSKNKTFNNASDALKHNGFYVYGVLYENRYIGWIDLLYMPKIGAWQNGIIYIDELWTAPVYREKGVASKLMEKAFELQKELNACRVRLYVDVENTDAQNLYKKYDLEIMGKSLFMES